ncbi:MAG: NUDIX domain-containing protein [Candidatus Lokiarchaeota archaeon]|nr:NUDIX domain-containing protein [Candidatus Lokiarchaeota archaeon]MBD3200455.1 NUDIX domain-containing protein [Candidatus Lokiarchaeota archaeon]
MSTIKPKAICVFSNEDKILVSEYYHHITKEPFYRPLGGNIEFTEDSKQGLKREILEELNTEICDLDLLDVIENIYYYKDKYSHEIMFVYDGAFEDESFYDKEQFEGFEKTDNRKFTVKWKQLRDFISGKEKLYPQGLLELLKLKMTSIEDFDFANGSITVEPEL